MVVWRLVTHHLDPERLLRLSKDEGRIAVGWNGLGDLRDYGSDEDIRQAVRETGNRNWPFSGRQLIAFHDEMKPGDLAILNAGGARRAVMRIESDYEYAGPLDDAQDYSHRRRASLTELNADAVWRAAGSRGKGQTVYWTVVRCANEVEVVDGQAVAAEA